MTTSRIELGPFVACNSFRNPALLAKMAVTLDEVSDGRLVLGIGAGWHEPEYHAFGYPYDDRVGRFEEALQIIAPLLREGRVDFEGRYCQARDCEIAPRGPRPAGPPILIGAQRPRMMRLAARFADIYDTDFHLEAGADSSLTEPRAPPSFRPASSRSRRFNTPHGGSEVPAPDPSSGLEPNTVILCRPPSSMGYFPYSLRALAPGPESFTDCGA